MRFPNAAKGVKKLFVAEILGLIGVISTLVSIVYFIISGVSGAAQENEGALVGGALTFIILTVINLGVSLTAFILRIVGVVQARKDEESFSTALAFIIIAIVCSVLAVVFNSISSVFSGFANTVTDLMNVLVTVFVISGIVKLSDQLNNGEMARKGVNILKLIVFINAFSLIGNLVVAFMGGITPSALLASDIIAIVVSVLSIVEVVLYLSFLGKAKNMLEKA